MTAQQPQYDPLEDRLAEQWPSGPWASEVEQFSDEDLSRLSAWIDDPAEDPDVDRLLADDPTLRRFIADLRQHGTHADPVDARLRLRLHRLMPEPTHVVARIGGWLSAAAAIVIVAVAGYRLGGASLEQRMAHDDTLATVTFGLSASGDTSDFVALFTNGDDR